MARRAVARRLPRPPSRTAWSSRVEARSLEVTPLLMAEAIANTGRIAGDVAFLAGLAREVAQTRAAELTRAYRQLVWVLPGFRRKQRDGRTVASNEVCVIFVVRRKAVMDPEHAQHLPRWLVTFAEHEGRRQPFALPTDVQDASGYAGATAHTAHGVWTRRPGFAAEDGSFACLVDLATDEGSLTCLLGAMHVFTPNPDGTLQVQPGHVVMPLTATGKALGNTPLAEGLPWGGVLRDDENADAPSFDVQLAVVDDAAQAMARERVPLRNLNVQRPFVSSLQDLLALLGEPGGFFLLTPDNHPQQPARGEVPLSLAAMPATASFPYSFATPAGLVDKEVFHAEPLRFDQVDDRSPLPGDSGSPIVFIHPDGTMTFVAMHIGGDGAGNSWAIAAWRIFDLDNWSAKPDNAQLTIVAP